MIETNLPVINDRCHTACGDCIFAVYDGDTQIGCDFNNRTDKYREKGCLVEAEDDEKKFFIVNNRFCLAKRTHHWKNKTDKKLSQNKESDDEQYTNDTYKALVRAELGVSYDYVIYIDSDDTDKIVTSLQDIMIQPILPKSVVLINNVNLEFGEVCRELLCKHVSKVKWQVRNILEDGKDRAVHTSIRTLNSRLFILVNAGYKLPENFISSLDKKINDDILDFCAIRPDGDGNCLISNPMVYRNIGGDKAGSFMSKLEDAPKVYPIINMEDICQN